MTDPVASLVTTQITSSALVVYLLQVLKNSKYVPWITADKKRLLQILSAVGAAAATIGVQHAWNPSARQLILTIPTLATVGFGLWHWLNHFVMQEMIYQMTAPKGTPNVQKAISRP